MWQDLLMQQIIEKILAFLAKKVLVKYKPLIIGITGSVGKTSARQAVFCVVKEQFRAFTPVKNYNNLLGLPLGILMSESPGKSFLGWLRVFARGMKLIVLTSRYPEVLVLEYGIDRAGEMEKLLDVAKPKIAILTNIGQSHLENFDSQEELAQEKAKLLWGTIQDGTIIWNAGCKVVAGEATKVLEERKDLKSLSYSLFEARDADVRADDVSVYFSPNLSTEVVVMTPTRVPNFKLSCIGTPHVLAGIVAVAVAETLNISSEAVKVGLTDYKPLPGRLNVLTGVKKSLIIDDTYNASPSSTLAALDALVELDNARLLSGTWSEHAETNRVAVLGDMLELGNEAENLHKQVGKKVVECKINLLVCVGNLGKLIGVGATEAGFLSENILLIH